MGASKPLQKLPGRTVWNFDMVDVDDFAKSPPVLTTFDEVIKV